MARIFTFKGKTIGDLQKMELNEFVKLLDSRQRRAIKRNGLEYKKLLAKIADRKSKNSDKAIRTHTREAVILPSWVGMKFAVHNGKEFKEMTIGEEMMGHRLGEFAFSTKRVLHSAPGIRATRGSKFLSVK
ncbi:MAG TPA: 30S ribosomal protein S19 [Candidatus Saccharimonadales bacterium]|nr:30S ribosomal protein S19 [Candidatus Saccharimonadales bacterium]